MTHAITEIVTFKPHSAVTEETLWAAIVALEENFHRSQPGFVQTQVLKNATNNEWVMIQIWESFEQLKAASARLMKDETAAPFRDALDPTTVKMSFWSEKGFWSQPSNS